jgi:hypothetical protein
MLSRLQSSGAHICRLARSHQLTLNHTLWPAQQQQCAPPSGSDRLLSLRCCASASPGPRVLSSQQEKKEYNLRRLTKGAAPCSSMLPPAGAHAAAVPFATASAAGTLQRM